MQFDDSAVDVSGVKDLRDQLAGQGASGVDLTSILGGLTDLLGGGSQQAAGAAAAGGAAAGAAAGGGLGGLFDQLRRGGLGDALDSWVGTGPNQPVNPEDLGRALGPDALNQLQQKAGGMNLSTLLPAAAAMLPQLINLLTPKGQAPQNQDDLSSMLGSITKQLGQ